MNMHHRIIKEEWLGLVLLDKANGLVMHKIGHVFLLTKFEFFSIGPIGSALGLIFIPIKTAAIKAKIIIKPCFIGFAWELAPFTDGGSCIARGFEGLS